MKYERNITKILNILHLNKITFFEREYGMFYKKILIQF